MRVLIAVFEAPTIVAGFDNVAMMCQPIQKSCGHLGISEDFRPFSKVQIGRDQDGGSLLELTDQVKQTLSTCGSQRQIPKFIQDDQINTTQTLSQASVLFQFAFSLRLSVLFQFAFSLRLVDKINYVEESGPVTMAAPN